MPILADWARGKNLPSFKTIFIGIAIGANVVVDFFVRSPKHARKSSAANFRGSSTTSYGGLYLRLPPLKRHTSSCPHLGPTRRVTTMKLLRYSRNDLSPRAFAQQSVTFIAWVDPSPCAVVWLRMCRAISQHFSSQRRCSCSGS
jgi:hypothetical protein